MAYTIHCKYDLWPSAISCKLIWNTRDYFEFGYVLRTNVYWILQVSTLTFCFTVIKQEKKNIYDSKQSYCKLQEQTRSLFVANSIGNCTMEVINKLYSTVSSTVSQLSSVLPGNPVSKDFEIGEHIASAGPGASSSDYFARVIQSLAFEQIINHVSV